MLNFNQFVGCFETEWGFLSRSLYVSDIRYSPNSPMRVALKEIISQTDKKNNN